jgi:hypothetical protein
MVSDLRYRPGVFEACAFSGGADLDDLFDEIGADVELQHVTLNRSCALKS